MLSICGGSGLVYVEPAENSLKGRLGCGPSAAGQNPELVLQDLSTDHLTQGARGQRHGQMRGAAKL